MTTTNKNNQKILKNTIFLYLRILFILFISLYTARVILKVLGIQDFGIYSLVAGIVTMLSFMSGAMASATQRFLSYEIGNKNNINLSNTFKMCQQIYILIMILVIIISESIGLWFIHEKLNIPVERLESASIAFQFSIISFCFSILSIPYISNILAQEKMFFFAIISSLEAILKLLILYIIEMFYIDRLISYPIALSIISFLSFIIYLTINRILFSYTKYKFIWDKKLFNTLTSYTGWNFFGNLSSSLVSQGINIILNLFYGPIINSSRAIATQVNSALFSFVSSLQMSVSPQIVKSYAQSDINRMKSLVFASAKYSFLLIYILSVPVILKTEFILKIWLGNVPLYTAIFVKLILIDSLIISLSGSLMSAFQATGKIKRYQIIVGTVLLLNLPTSFILLKLEFPPYSIFIASIVLSFIALYARIFLLKLLLPDLIKNFISYVIVKITIVTLATYIPIYYISTIFNDSLVGLISITIISSIFILIFVWIIAMSPPEKNYIIQSIKKLSLAKKKRAI
ncbi:MULTISPECIES: lipopolysaccharide biosynthesis protein [Providencia]|uniref:lipopolysaccharide biosynthesis protein n=1 Tax=Providencia TaxID=586 RepID=UPI0014199054|nr:MULTISPECIES: lipopolysaccharide biosynthesis protein [Providencia]ELR5146636.1 lipopolysaccharide biosynthesis protein [Providencia rettgeri]NIA44659.1 lipopolysaccharide biosynthesis protein [Providencia rettgeri]NIA96913.1 lipopolysaccharide biosynthesis protein [Providencia rettgeri]NIB14737.1 lipopolysaccharide biosynthesis protein [Providencia rettgeri]NIB34949.1 lipopolysaccharide biosynthesis protein [Providencia rettgeri]